MLFIGVHGQLLSALAKGGKLDGVISTIINQRNDLGAEFPCRLLGR
jgi:hypothetical protein